jgi:hypothetical protein
VNCAPDLGLCPPPLQEHHLQFVHTSPQVVDKDGSATGSLGSTIMYQGPRNWLQLQVRPLILGGRHLHPVGCYIRALSAEELLGKCNEQTQTEFGVGLG